MENKEELNWWQYSWFNCQHSSLETVLHLPFLLLRVKAWVIHRPMPDSSRLLLFRQKLYPCKFTFFIWTMKNLKYINQMCLPKNIMYIFLPEQHYINERFCESWQSHSWKNRKEETVRSYPVKYTWKEVAKGFLLKHWTERENESNCSNSEYFLWFMYLFSSSTLVFLQRFNICTLSNPPFLRQAFSM